MNCPLQRFKKCPKHNEDGGCAWWLSYTTNKDSLEAQIRGCAMTLTPMLLLEQANNLGTVASEVNKVGAEVSAGRVENIREQQANRAQFVALASGHKQVVQVDYTTNIKELSYE